MNRRRLYAAAALVTLAGCPQAKPPDAGPFDAGVFVAKCTVSATSGIGCADAGPCTFSYASSLDCGNAGAAAVSTAAASGGKAHALFSVMDLQNNWHTQWTTLRPAEPQPMVQTDVVPAFRSTVTPRLPLAASGDEPPLAFHPSVGVVGIEAAVLSGATPTPETVWSQDGGNVALYDVAMAPGGRGYALLSTASGPKRVSRSSTGSWTSTDVRGSTLALDPSGSPFTGYWQSASGSMTLDTLHVRDPDGGDQTLRAKNVQSPSLFRIVIGADDAGTFPAAAYGYEGNFVVVPAGDGGYRELRVPEPGVTNTCPTGVLHVTCNDCPNPTCSRRGDGIIDLELARASDGSVFLAVLMMNVDVDRKVTATPTTFGGVVINCDCDVQTTRDDSHTTEVIVYRVVPGATAALQERTRFTVPPRSQQLGFQQVDGRFHLSVVDSSEITRRPVLHYVVLDAASLL